MASPIPEDTDMDAETDAESAEEPEEDASTLSFMDDGDSNTGDPYWMLFKTVVTHADETGQSTAKPFLTLPNKR